jgi:hypothetical protein
LPSSHSGAPLAVVRVGGRAALLADRVTIKQEAGRADGISEGATNNSVLCGKVVLLRAASHHIIPVIISAVDRNRGVMDAALIPLRAQPSFMWPRHESRRDGCHEHQCPERGGPGTARDAWKPPCRAALLGREARDQGDHCRGGTTLCPPRARAGASCRARALGRAAGRARRRAAAAAAGWPAPSAGARGDGAACGDGIGRGAGGAAGDGSGRGGRQRLL